MRRISLKEQENIISLRKRGYSIPEIVSLSGSAQTTVQRYTKNVSIPKSLLKRLKEKQGGAKERAAGLRENVSEEVHEFLADLSERERFLLTIGLYLGEGTKRDFSIINSDPRLLQTIIYCLRTTLHIPAERFSISLRLHKGIDIEKAKYFWSYAIGLPKSQIIRIELIEGKKKGKLPYGMCRLRVISGIRERLFLQRAIELIGKDSAEKVVSMNTLS